MSLKTDPGPNANPEMGRRLRAMRLEAGYDVDAFAREMALPSADWARIERGEDALPPAFLPLLARLLDAPLGAVLAEIHATQDTAAELHTLVTAFNAIPGQLTREALLTLALAAGDRPA